MSPAQQALQAHRLILIIGSSGLLMGPNIICNINMCFIFTPRPRSLKTFREGRGAHQVYIYIYTHTHTHIQKQIQNSVIFLPEKTHSPVELTFTHVRNSLAAKALGSGWRATRAVTATRMPETLRFGFWGFRLSVEFRGGGGEGGGGEVGGLGLDLEAPGPKNPEP